jgi:hypothetical protein
MYNAYEDANGKYCYVYPGNFIEKYPRANDDKVMLKIVAKNSESCNIHQ